MLRLARFLKNYKKHLILGPMFKVIEAIIELFVPLVTAALIDHGVKNGDTAYVIKQGLLLLLLAVLGLSCTLVCQYFASVASQGVGTELRRSLFRHITSLSHAEYDKLSTPAMQMRMTGDINQLQLAVAMLIRLVIRAPFLAVGAVIMAMTIDLRLSIIVLLASILISLALFFIIRASLPLISTARKRLEHLALITREALTGARVIRAYSKSEHETERFQTASDELSDASVHSGQISALTKPLTAFIMNAGITAVVWYGGYRVYGASITQGELIAFVNYMTQIMLALSVVANITEIFTKAAASASSVNEIFDMQSSIVDGKGAAADMNADAVAFDNVSFGYVPEKKVLDGITFKAPRGSTVGVIGGTGSGKSTLASLVPRLYDVTDGAVSVFGHDVRDYKTSDLRGMIASVPQQASLVSGTVRSNLTWGAPNASDDELWAALEAAQAADFVRSKDGLDTVIEQNGRNLSGGQRQRITIARALAAKPEILILDDSFSALDASTSLKLREALLKMSLTQIIVSQRVSAIRGCDMIIVLENGSAVGMGTHKQLMENCPLYLEICKSQEAK